MDDHELMRAFFQACVHFDIECSRSEHLPPHIQKWRASFATVRELRAAMLAEMKPIPDELAQAAEAIAPLFAESDD